jgi:uncharacterized membrane protein YgcG
MVCFSAAKNKKGTILVLGAFLVMVTVTALLGINHIYENLCSIMSYQNKADAHMLSVVGFYVETLDKVSWINAQLRRLGVLCALVAFVPQLAPLMVVVQKTADGLQMYQDFLLLKLTTYAPILDNKLRLQNDLSVPGNYHYFKYRRQLPISLGFVTIPGLIEIHSDIFNTACARHRGIITDSSACVDNEIHNRGNGGSIGGGSSSDSWFAPTEEKWNVVMSNAY